MRTPEPKLRCLIAELLAAKSESEIERMLDLIRARGASALRATAASLTREVGRTRRLDRAAVAVAAEAGGAEGRELLLALVSEGEVDLDERVAAMNALPWDGSDQTLSRLLEELAGEGHLGPTALSEAIVEHLLRAPSGFDWRGAVRGTHSSLIARLARFVPGDARPGLAELGVLLAAEARRRRGPSCIYQRYSLHHRMAPATGMVVPYNPYLAEYEQLVSRPQHDFWQERSAVFDLRESYAYAVPTRAALRLAAACSPIVEIGAGAGYWAWLLRQLGADVVAYDAEPPDGTFRNRFFEGARAWTEVRQGGPEAVARHPGRALFLCWPPRDTMAEESLSAFSGDVVLYAGGWRRSCATDSFFDTLEASFEQTAQALLPSWLDQDALRVFRRRG